MTITNKKSGKQITIPVAIDSRFQGDIVLENIDVQLLDLSPTTTSQILLADYVTYETVINYERVKVAVSLNDGTTVFTYLYPSSPQLVEESTTTVGLGLGGKYNPSNSHPGLLLSHK